MSEVKLGSKYFDLNIDSVLQTARVGMRIDLCINSPGIGYSFIKGVVDAVIRNTNRRVVNIYIKREEPLPQVTVQLHNRGVGKWVYAAGHIINEEVLNITLV